MSSFVDAEVAQASAAADDKGLVMVLRLRAVSATLTRLAEADRDARQEAVAAAEELLQRPPTSGD